MQNLKPGMVASYDP